jgi:hypothetical protein
LAVSWGCSRVVSKGALMGVAMVVSKAASMDESMVELKENWWAG